MSNRKRKSAITSNILAIATSPDEVVGTVAVVALARVSVTIHLVALTALAVGVGLCIRHHQ
jgi:hypothetical protein